MSQPTRIVGIRHRVKFTADGEARPTQICIIYPDGAETSFELKDEQAELDFLLGSWPSSFRKATADDDPTTFAEHHLRYHKDKSEGLRQVPASYDGLQSGDRVAMVLGGSGDRFAYALSNRGDMIGAAVVRITPSLLKEHRGERDKDDDAKTLAQLLDGASYLFQATGPRERQTILVRALLDARSDAQKARMACEQRIRSRLIGRIFLSEAGHYPEGGIEAAYKEAKDNSEALKILVRLEREATSELEKTVKQTVVWQEIFEGIEGIGPVLAASLIAPVGDIRRFPDDAHFAAYMGVHVMTDGRFPRKRSGELANWDSTARQMLYQFGEQMNRRPESVWGIKLLCIKKLMRERTPQAIAVDRGLKEAFLTVRRFCAQFLVWVQPEGDSVTSLEELGVYISQCMTALSSSERLVQCRARSSWDENRFQVSTSELKGLPFGTLKAKGTTVKLFSDGHIHKSAKWRALNAFAKWVYQEWYDLEAGGEASEDIGAATA